MGILKFIINVSDAVDYYRNFSCSSQNIDGFLRCYRHARGNECYGDSTNIQVATSGHGTGTRSYNTNKDIERVCCHLTLSEAFKFSFARKVCIGKGRLELTRREAIKLLFTRKVWHEKDESGREFLALERYDLNSFNTNYEMSKGNKSSYDGDPYAEPAAYCPWCATKLRDTGKHYTCERCGDIPYDEEDILR